MDSQVPPAPPTPTATKPFPRQARSRARATAEDVAWLRESGSLLEEVATDESWDGMDSEGIPSIEGNLWAIARRYAREHPCGHVFRSAVHGAARGSLGRCRTTGLRSPNCTSFQAMHGRCCLR